MSTCKSVEYCAAHAVMILLSLGVCMKQQKKLNKAINMAQDHGTQPETKCIVKYAVVTSKGQ